MGGAEDVEEGQEVVGVAVLVLPFDAAQVVDDVAAAHDEVALLAQAGELLAELVGGVLGDVAVDGELDDGDVGLGEDVDEDAPRAVVDAPAVVSQLKSLEREGIVSRTVYAEVPPRVEYSLTEIGRKFESVLASIEAWGYDYIDFLHANRPTAS